MHRAVAVVMAMVLLAAGSAWAQTVFAGPDGAPAGNAGSAQTGPEGAPLDYKNPEQLLITIKRVGARTVVSQLYGSQEDAIGPGWFYVLKQIATGKEIWLQVAAALFPGADAATSEDLGNAEGDALAKAPIRVLSLFGIGPCGNFTMRGYAEDKATLDRQRQAVAAIRDPEYQAARKACLKEINGAYAPLKRYYGVP